MRFALWLSFLGERYHGWQIQKNADSVQAHLEAALSLVFGERIAVVGCSRTDAGVSAEEFCCHFDAARLFDPEKLPLALNANLPADIAVFRARLCEAPFHARFDCRGKEYQYRIWNSSCRSPFWENRAARIPRALSESALAEAARPFLGTHDFSSFMAKGSEVEGTVRTVRRFEVVRDGELVTFSVEGDGFLYHQVRIMVGTLLALCDGKLSLPLPEIIEKHDRRFAGPTAPAEGLLLKKVFY